MIAVPALIAAALAVGVAYGRRRTRRALQTTSGRQRHRMPSRRQLSRMVITGEVLSMEDALQTAALHRTPAAELVAGPPPAHPPTVALRRVDGTLPTRPPAPRIGDSIRRTVDDAAAAQRTRQFPEWNPRR